MTKRMLIDATHEEETRVAIVEDNKLEEFEYESTYRRPLKGNIYLAKVTRVEPSLQAAFVNFGGNRHGFLPFSEIHPDYFRIPVADREALIAEQQAELEEHDKRLREAEEAAEAADDDAIVEGDGEEEVGLVEDDAIAEDSSDEEEAVSEEAEEEKPKKRGRPKKKTAAKKIEIVEVTEAVEGEEDTKAPEGDEAQEEAQSDDNAEADESADTDANAQNDEESEGEDEGRRNRRGGRGGRGRGRGGRNGGHGGRGRGRGRRRNYDNEDDETRFRFSLRRKYKIQEVVKRGQIMLIQVSKEERGNKGAAVSTYLSLPGRYCVLMPNSPRGGGVSRKVPFKDRSKMKDLLKELETPQGMSTIVRTAGVSRTKTEVKRDLDYLMRLWDNIRSLTLESTAPAMVYEEANLIKRAVRDLYSRDVEEVLVAGDKGHKTAKDFMKLMVPSHAKRVKEYEVGGLPLFSRYQIEKQISDIGEVEVTLPSGGYLVINPTEALVSVDVNSGRATKERHIEGTALKTNLEAAEEVARQLRLRDLGGLVVIDFIDMEDRRNNGKVERKMRDALSVDRARVQCGRISNFGLMELSRQRLNPSLGESQFELCSKCEGRGRVRTADAQSIILLRALEEEGARGRAAQVIAHVSGEVALYILNYKRGHLASLEEQYNFEILIRVDDEMGATTHRIEVSKPVSKDNENDEADEAEKNEANSAEDAENDDNEKSSSRRRGRRGRGRKNSDDVSADVNEDAGDDESQAQDEPSDEDSEQPKKRRGRKRKVEEAAPEADQAEATDADDAKVVADKADKDDAAKEEKPKKPRGRKKKVVEETAVVENADAPPAAEKASNDDAPAAIAEVETTPKAKKEEAKEPEASKYETVNEAPKKKKKGWWSR